MTTGLVVVSNIKQFGNTLRTIEKLANTLYVQLHIPYVSKTQQCPLPSWGRLISQLYMESSTHLCNNMDLRILVAPLRGHKPKLPTIDMIFSDSKQPSDICERLRADLNIPSDIMCLAEESAIDIQEYYEKYLSEEHKVYETVVLGGTFDRIHLGHKIFLTQAVLRACNRLVVGVTTAEMHTTKTLAELILPIEQRIDDVRKFLMEIDPSLQYDIVPISDPFGPTKDDPNMDLLVVSAETMRGGQKVNELRAAKNMRELDIFCIEMVERASVASESGPKESKISSSNIRIDLLGTRLRQPIPRPNLPIKPYIIGLTGGIASGKSRMGDRLQNMGAVVYDCDKIAHEIYEPDQQCYHKIIAHFGKEILGDNKTIDRAKLGAIVFGDPKQLSVLNGIVWPELLTELKKRIAALQPTPQVLVIEAAVLLRAGWENECHEIWSMIVPPDEAVRRVMERNKLSEAGARQRISSQLSNAEIVANSNVIFSSQWDDKCTTTQAKKAWDMIMKELDDKNSK